MRRQFSQMSNGIGYYEPRNFAYIKGSFDENFCSDGQAGDFLRLDWHWYICIDIGYRSTG